MQTKVIKYKIVDPLFYTKCRTIMAATDYSAAFDLSACISEPMTIYPGYRAELVSTGVAFDLMPDEDTHYMGLLFIRSGLSLKGLSLANGVGLIDPDYQGEVKVPLVNHTSDVLQIVPGQRIAQISFMPISYVEPELTQSFGKITLRGSGGFGSTGEFLGQLDSEQMNIIEGQAFQNSVIDAKANITYRKCSFVNCQFVSKSEDAPFYLEDCLLESCDLFVKQAVANLSVHNCALIYCSLTESNLVNADFTGSSLLGADIKDANLISADFTGADLTNANLTNARLSGVNFTNARLKWVNFTNADLESADFNGADLAGANLKGTILEKILEKGKDERPRFS